MDKSKQPMPGSSGAMMNDGGGSLMGNSVDQGGTGKETFSSGSGFNDECDFMTGKRVVEDRDPSAGNANFNDRPSEIA